MAINFLPAISATTSEQREFGKLKEMETVSKSDAFDMWQATIDFKASDSRTFSCFGMYEASSSQFFCGYGLRESTPKLNISHKVFETRYGDIDKDGDIDIAVKLTDGAIYVFHNLSK